MTYHPAIFRKCLPSCGHHAMEDTLLLLVLCSVMFLGAFLAGMIPLAFTVRRCVLLCD